MRPMKSAGRRKGVDEERAPAAEVAENKPNRGGLGGAAWALRWESVVWSLRMLLVGWKKIGPMQSALAS